MKVSSYTFSFRASPLFNILWTVAFFFLFDFVLGSTLAHYYFKQKSGLNYRTTYAIQEAYQDILILGSSRANHHYRPDVIFDKLGLSSYNAGRDGQGMFYVEGIFHLICKRYRPKIVVIDIAPSMIKSGKRKYDRLSVFLPYYKRHPEIRSIVRKKSRFEHIFALSNTYPYNSMLFTIAKYNYAIEKDLNGYLPVFRDLDPTTLPPLKTRAPNKPPSVDPETLNSLERICKVSQEKKIKLIFVTSPYYDKNFEQVYIDIIKEVVVKNNAVFYDFSVVQNISENPYMYADRTHLNHKGAGRFTKILCDAINNDNMVD